MADWITLPERTVLQISGAERAPFLDRLVTNKVTALAPGTARYAALLTPQGKYLFDFILVETGEAFLLDVAAAQADALIQRLTMYKLRAAVEIEKTDLAVYAAPDPDAAAAGALCVPDPRHPGLGVRAYGRLDGAQSDPTAYETHRLTLGVPDLVQDAQVEKTLSLEADLDWLNGVDFTKGCFVGQELTARMKHRGKVRKRLLPVEVAGGAPDPDTPVLHKDGKEAGQIRSSQGTRAIAFLRLDDLDKTPLTADGREVRVTVPPGLEL